MLWNYIVAITELNFTLCWLQHQEINYFLILCILWRLKLHLLGVLQGNTRNIYFQFIRKCE